MDVNPWIVLPAMNEEETLPKLLDSILNEFAKKDYCVIVINDGSTDRTGRIAEASRPKQWSHFGTVPSQA